MITVNNTGYSSTESSRKIPRVFLQIILKFNSDREDFLDEICILLSLVLFWIVKIGSIVVKKMKYEIICDHLLGCDSYWSSSLNACIV